MRTALQTLLAAFSGVFLGFITAKFLVDAMEGAPFFMIVASIINPILVCLVARGWWTLVGIIPTLATEVGLGILKYRHAHKYDSIEWGDFVHSNYISERMPWFVGCLVLSLFVSAIAHGLGNSKAEELHDPTKGS